MKKKVYIFLILVTLLLIVFWFLIVKKSNIENSIPSYADTVVCIDKQNIRNSVLSYYFLNPSEYFSKEDSAQTKIENYGVEIPNYLVFFSANTISKGTFFTELKLTDKKQLINVLLNKEFNKTSYGSYEVYESNASPNISVFFSDSSKNIVISISIFNSDSNTIKVVNDLFNRINLLLKNDKVYDKLKSSNNHITVVANESRYVKEQSFLTVNFLKGKVEVKGEIFNKKEYAFKTGTDVILDTTSLINLSANFEGLFFNELIESVNKSEFKKKTNLDIDSLTHYFTPSLNFTLKDVNTTYDTAISYSYDDNFNPIEKELITPKQTARFSLNLNKKRLKAFNYFVHDSLIKRIEDDYVFTSYPFQKVYTHNKGEQISLSTNRNGKTNHSIITSTNFINVTGDLRTFSETIYIKEFLFYFAQKQGVEVKGEVRFKSKERHAIFSMLNMFKQ